MITADWIPLRLSSVPSVWLFPLKGLLTNVYVSHILEQVSCLNLSREANLCTLPKLGAFILLFSYHINLSWLAHAVMVHTCNTDVQHFSMFLLIRCILREGRDCLSL